jgi:hypothetical protein
MKLRFTLIVFLILISSTFASASSLTCYFGSVQYDDVHTNADSIDSCPTVISIYKENSGGKSRAIYQLATTANLKKEWPCVYGLHITKTQDDTFNPDTLNCRNW